MKHASWKQKMKPEGIYGFSCRGERYFYEAENGGIYKYNPLLWDIFALLPTCTGEQIIRELSGSYPGEMVKSVLKSLNDRKLLSQGSGKPSMPDPEPNTGINEMYLQVSHQCNLNCTYCYAQGGNFGGPDRMMMETTARNAVGFLLRESGANEILSLNFDGGEPLLNFPLIETTAAYAKEKAQQMGKRILFSISTNGTLFTKQNVEYLTANRFGIGVSIDGDQATHDNARKFKNGQGSYRTLGENLYDTELFKYRKPVQARATITRDALHCSRTVSHLFEMGFRYIYLEPASGHEEEWAINRGALEIIKEEFNKIAVFYKNQLLQGHRFIIRNFFRYLKNIHRKNRCGYRCAAARQMLAVSPEGNLYPCYKFVGIPDHFMGNVNNGVFDRSIGGKFENTHVNNGAACKTCWARYICGGGCPYLAKVSNNDISLKDELDCELTKHLIKLSLELYADISNENKEIWSRLLV